MYNSNQSQCCQSHRFFTIHNNLYMVHYKNSYLASEKNNAKSVFTGLKNNVVCMLCVIFMKIEVGFFEILISENRQILKFSLFDHKFSLEFYRCEGNNIFPAMSCFHSICSSQRTNPTCLHLGTRNF